MEVLEILLRGLAAGAMLATASGMLGAPPRSPARWAGAVFCLSVAAFALHSEGAETQALGPLKAPVWLLSAGGAGYFWLFATCLFEDRRWSWDRLAPIGLLTAVAGVAVSLPRATADGVWVAHNLLEVALVLHVLAVIWRSWGGDLVAARRSLRGPFIGFIGVYSLVLSGLEIADALGFAAPWEGLAQAGTLAALTLIAAPVFLQARARVFTPPAHAAPLEAVAPRDRPTLSALQDLMAGDEIWRREGLTIGQMAEAVGAPEHRLRRLINDGLGHRNFADFVNARRIEAACAALSDPAQARTSVAAIAFDLGYGSLGPFNRAFRQVTGTTPSAWRDQALTASSNPEKPG